MPLRMVVRLMIFYPYTEDFTKKSLLFLFKGKIRNHIKNTSLLIEKIVHWFEKKTRTLHGFDPRYNLKKGKLLLILVTI